MLSTVLIVLLILIIVGALPTWGWHGQGWAPAGGLGLVLVILDRFAIAWKGLAWIAISLKAARSWRCGAQIGALVGGWRTRFETSL
jgi:hypothetical protein